MPTDFCDKCESIKETDPQYETAKRLMQKQGCYQHNLDLTTCLNTYHNDWRSCKNQTDALAACLAESKNKMK